MDYGYSSGGTELSILFLVWGITLGIAALVSLVIYVLTGFSFMKLFRKVGVEPWAAWVPIFNFWRLLELGAQPGWWSVLSLVPYANYASVVFECIAAYRVAAAFRKDGSWVVLFIFLPFVWAWMLAADDLPYEPELMTQRGWQPPQVGYGSTRGPYMPGASGV